MPYAFNEDRSKYDLRNMLADMVYPVGSIYMSTANTNPGTLFGGTWVAWGSGRVPVGINTGDTDFNTSEKTGGAKAVALTTEQLAPHTHTVGAHAHGLNSHTHSVPAHAHGLNSHIHSVPAHNHGLNSHTHSIPALNVTGGNADKYLMAYGTNGAQAGGSPLAQFFAGDTLLKDAGIKTAAGTTGAATGNTANSAVVPTGAASGNTANSSALTTGAAAGSTANSTAFNTASNGGGTAHNNLQPYITCYMWKRTA